MGRSPCCVREGLNRGAWTALEDQILVDYINAHGEGKWRRIPKEAGLKRCGKSCRLRWLNYLRPDIKRGNITQEEEDLIIRLHKLLGNRWSLIAGRIPGRTDNEIKNYWNTKLGKKVFTHEHQIGQQPLLQLNVAESNEDKIIINKTKPLTTATEVVESIAAVRTKAVRCSRAVVTTSSLQYLVVETGDKFITTSDEAVDKSSATSFISTTTATSEDHLMLDFDVGRLYNVSANIPGNSDHDDYYWELCRFGEYDCGGAAPNSHKWQSAGGDHSTMFSEEMLRDWMTDDCFHRQI